jgi:hypothetical protein
MGHAVAMIIFVLESPIVKRKCLAGFNWNVIALQGQSGCFGARNFPCDKGATTFVLDHVDQGVVLEALSSAYTEIKTPKQKKDR